ncbi:DnaJ domain-containing protein [Hymenobacter sp. NBH84]|uniref:J domain-containing protein n=1 Tax=Hymenobacter sp. NBH84 TaxID=2596915 RepID=UPI00162375B9|nr:DnaJ domain-containing protein [Hymenobacter sp. NBH84]
MSQNHYHVLGVATTATPQEIKTAYKRLAVRYHPDMHGGSAQFEEEFKAVAAAYQVLSDPGRRATYDHQLRMAVRRAEEQRRAQHYRAHSQHVYGVPMPPPAPLRTRPPAGSAERYYRPIPKRRRFTRRDWWLLTGFIVGLVLFCVSVKVTLDYVSATRNYRYGLRAYTNRQWKIARSYFTSAIAFRPTYAAAHRRRGEIEHYINHNYAAARADYQVALAEEPTGKGAAALWARLGQCEVQLGLSQAAAISLTRALQQDSLLSDAYLLRGEIRLFEQRQFAGAIQDFSTGLRQRTAAGWSVDVKPLTYRGLAYYKQGNYAAARTDYRQVLLITPQNGQVHFLLGRLAQQEGNTGAACEFFRRAVRLGYLYASEAVQECQ